MLPLFIKGYEFPGHLIDIPNILHGQVIDHTENIATVSLVLSKDVRVLLDFWTEKRGNFHSPEGQIEFTDVAVKILIITVLLIIKIKYLLGQAKVWATVSTPTVPSSNPNTYYFSIEHEVASPVGQAATLVIVGEGEADIDE